MDRLYAVVCWIRDPNNLTAVSTTVIACFTAILTFVGYCQARLIRKSVDLSRQEFVATHRPIIRIKRITPPPTLLPDERIQLTVEAVNVGDTQALIFEMGIDVYFPGDLVTAGPRSYSLPPLPAGHENIITFVNRTRTLSEANIDAIELGTVEWRLLGIINYRDDNRVVRATGIARTYDRRLRQFVKVHDDDPEADREFEN